MEMGMTPVPVGKNSHGFVSLQAEICAPLRYAGARPPNAF